MPVPALLGIPALVAGFGRIITGWIAYMAVVKAAKVSFFLFVMTSIYYGTTELFSQFEGWIAQVVVSAPPFAGGLMLFLPSNTGTCISVILGAEAACALFRVSGYILEKQWEAVREL
ncbi:hypothetical protein [Shewanella algae]|uniref:Uncharacterized protein n=1 Tax=bacterium 19NY03SH02 TaxID=2920631 RepID=A0AAU6UYU5_UNCXX